MAKSQRSWILLIGISSYAEGGLRLDYAAANAADLEAVLLNRDGCAVPAAQITRLSDAEATAERVVAALTVIGIAAGPDDTIIVYFAGHGERVDDGFYLLTHETDVSRIPQTSLSMDAFEAALGATCANGILVILDCCKSAGFAESADGFFRKLSRSEFRLLLSASRAGQSSYEFASVRNTLFSAALVEVLSGSVVGSELGVIYFQDMFRFIQMRVAENLIKFNLDPSLQEPVYAGTSTKDPRLFILRNQSIARVESATPRFSSAFVRRRVQRLLTVVGSVISAVLVAYYIYLDHSRYIGHETSVYDGGNTDLLAIYAGDPGLNWLGFPHRILVTDIRTDAVPPQVRPGIGSPIVLRMNASIEPVLFAHLSPEWQGAVSFWWDGNLQKAMKYLAADPYVDDDDLPGLDQAYAVLGTAAGKNEEAKLKDLLFDQTPRNSAVLLRRIATLDPDAAIAVAMTKDDDEDYSGAGFRRAVLEGLPEFCTPMTAKWLTAGADLDDDSAWYGAVSRTGCELPSNAYAASLRNETGLPHRLYWLGGLIGHAPSDFTPWLVSSIANLATYVETQEATASEVDNMKAYQDAQTLAVELRTAEFLCPASLPAQVMNLIGVASVEPRVFAVEALATQSASNIPLIAARAGNDPWVLAALVRAGWFDESRLSVAMKIAVGKADARIPQGASILVLKAQESQSDAVIYFLRAVRREHRTVALPIVRAIFEATRQPQLRIETLRTLMVLGQPPGGRDVSFPSAEITTPSKGEMQAGVTLAEIPAGSLLLDDSQAWFIRHDRRAFSDFMVTLGTDVEDTAQVLGRVPLPQPVLSSLRVALGDQGRRLKAATALAMRGTASDLEALLSSPDANVRSQATAYAVYNDHLAEVIDRPALRLFGAETRFDLGTQLAMRRSFEARQRRLPRDGRDVLLALLRDEYVGASEGYKLVIQDAIDDIDGGSGWLTQHIELDQLR